MQPQNIHSGSYPDDTDVKVVELFRFENEDDYEDEI